MNIKVKYTDLAMTEAIQEYAIKKISEGLEKFIQNNSEQSIYSEIDLSRTNKHQTNGDIYKASVKVEGFSSGPNIFVEATTEDLYASIDVLKDKLESALNTTKKKRQSVSRKLASRFKKIFQKRT